MGVLPEETQQKTEFFLRAPENPIPGSRSSMSRGSVGRASVSRGSLTVSTKGPGGLDQIQSQIKLLIEETDDKIKHSEEARAMNHEELMRSVRSQEREHRLLAEKVTDLWSTLPRVAAALEPLTGLQSEKAKTDRAMTAESAVKTLKSLGCSVSPPWALQRRVEVIRGDLEEELSKLRGEVQDLLSTKATCDDVAILSAQVDTVRNAWETGGSSMLLVAPGGDLASSLSQTTAELTAAVLKSKTPTRRATPSSKLSMSQSAGRLPSLQSKA